MYIAALLVAVLLALHGLAASTSTYSAACCVVNTTLIFTKTLTTSCAEATLYVPGNGSIAPGISMTSANSSTNLVTSGSAANHTSFVSAYSTAKNTTGKSLGGIMTISILGNTTLSKTNMTKTSTIEYPALLTALGSTTLPKNNMTKTSTTESASMFLSTTRAGPRITKDPAPGQASPETGDVHAFPSQLGTSTTTLTKETTVTQLQTYTCTLGEPCSFRKNNGTALGSSHTSPYNIVGPTSGSSGPELHSTLNSSETSTADILLISSTMTRTITLKTSAGVFAEVTTLTSGTATSLTSSAVTSLAGSSESTTEALEHGTTLTNTTEGPLANSTSIASTSTTSTSIVSTAITSISTMSSSIMSTSNVSTSMTNMSMSSAALNDTMSFTSLSLFSSSSMASPISSSTMPMTSTIPGSAPTPPRPSNPTVIIIPYTKTVAATATSLASAGTRTSPPRLFTMLFHVFSYIDLASAESTRTTVSTTTFNPVKTITATPTGCAFHPNSQECMPNLGFNNVGGRPSPPFVAALLANLVPVVHAHVKRAETRSSSSTTTVTLTVLKNQETDNGTAIETSTEDINFTAAGTAMMSIPPVPSASEGMFTSASSMTMSMPMDSSTCVPQCNESDGIVATNTPTTPFRSSPGSGSTPSIPSKPAASGEAGKGGIGRWVALVGGVVVGLF